MGLSLGFRGLVPEPWRVPGCWRATNLPYIAHPCTRSMWRAAARWFRSPAMKCRCNTPPACSGNTSTREARPACSTSRIWASSRLRPKSGKVEDAALALERLVPQDIVAVAPGRQRYAQFTNTDGGILDDLMVANFGDHLFLVVNAACKAEDEAHLRAHLSDACVDRITGRSRADRAAGAEGRIGTGEILCRRDRDAVHGFRSAQGRRLRLLRLALRLYRRGRV